MESEADEEIEEIDIIQKGSKRQRHSDDESDADDNDLMLDDSVSEE